MGQFIKIIVLGVIQGVTEWLPISSTGHMILANEFIKLDASDNFTEVFLVLVQLGSIIAVVVLFWGKLFPFALNGGFRVKKEVWTLWLKILAASVPAGIIGVIFDSRIDAMFYNAVTVALMLIIYGVLFIVTERANSAEKKEPSEIITFRTALIIGAFQTLALIPGTSRSGATILGGMLFGLSRTAAASFSFFLAIPAMFGASAVKLIKSGFEFTAYEMSLMGVGMLTAFLVSLAAIRCLLAFVRKHSFEAFGWYRIALGAVVMLYFVLLT